MHQILNNTKSTVFQPFQDLESRALLYHYMKKPDRWWEANARFANSIIMSVTTLEVAYSLVVAALALVGGCSSSSDQKIDCLRGHKKVFDDFLERRKLGTQRPCFMTELLDMNTDGEFSTEDCYFIGGTLIEAGSDTTRVTLMEILAAAVLYPDWVERALQQLDSVCGSNAERIPNFGDMPKLPLIKAIVKESMRWKLPQGTVVTINHWAISHLDHGEPERFYPERFLDEDLDVPTKGHLGFGAGKPHSLAVFCCA
ncbi:cytochrome P450 monooxygenase [Fusarium subglutinans]|uniref:Cytochrome P450 monooxygenase n=1 Tax=Gibberella subglutinans TaxID=42677 RepID=A0A8H5KJK8_GIBSU|nr:cytochrome P450 monooxygenase [Fusarium subglutinans]KAF5574468.1 cytochrome P450 monooxygenase [Fusarium subglutinans]